MAKDAATEEQAKEQLSMHQEMDDAEKKDLEDDDEMVNQLKEEEPMDSDDVEKKTAEMVNQSKKSRKKGEQDGQDGGQAESKVEGMFCVVFFSNRIKFSCFQQSKEMSP